MLRSLMVGVVLVASFAAPLRLTVALQDNTADVTASWTYEVPPEWAISFVWWVTEEATGNEVARDTTGLNTANWQHARTDADVAYVFHLDPFRIYGDVWIPTGQPPTTERYVVTARPPNVLVASSTGTTQPDSILHDPAMELTEGTLWLEFTPNTTTGVQGLWSKDFNGYQAGGHLTVTLANDSVRFRIQSDVATYSVTAPNVAAGQRNQVALTFGPSGFNGWLNGTQVMASPYTGGIEGNLNAVVVGANSQTDQPWENPLDGTMHTTELYEGLYDFSARWGEPPIIPPPAVCDTCISIDVAWLVRTLRWHEDSLVLTAYGAVGQRYACETKWTYTGDPCRPGGHPDAWPVCRRDGDDMEILAFDVAACGEALVLNLPDGSSYQEVASCAPHVAYQRWYESNGNLILPDQCPA